MHKYYGCIECLDEICHPDRGTRCGIENRVSPICTKESLIEEMEELNKIAQEHLDDYLRICTQLFQLKTQTDLVVDEEMTFVEGEDEQPTKKRKQQEQSSTATCPGMHNLLMLGKLEKGSKFALIRALAKRDMLQEKAMEYFQVEYICKKHVKFAK